MAIFETHVTFQLCGNSFAGVGNELRLSYGPHRNLPCLKMLEILRIPFVVLDKFRDPGFLVYTQVFSTCHIQHFLEPLIIALALLLDRHHSLSHQSEHTHNRSNNLPRACCETYALRSSSES